MSPRFVLTYIKHLPLESAFVAELRGGQRFRGWDDDRYQLAAIINVLRSIAYMYLVSHVDPKKHKPADPESWPIPDGKPKKAHKPGSFAAIALARINAVKKLKERGG